MTQKKLAKNITQVIKERFSCEANAMGIPKENANPNIACGIAKTLFARG